MLDSYLVNELKRFILFVMIGVFNTAFDFVIWHSIVKLVKDESSLNKFILKLKLNKYSFSQGLAFILANIVSYFLNRYIAFSDSSVNSTARSITSFFTVSLFSFTISVLLMNFLTKNERILQFVAKNDLLAKRWPIVAKLLIAGVTLMTNFLGYKFFVFNN